MIRQVCFVILMASMALGVPQGGRPNPIPPNQPPFSNQAPFPNPPRDPNFARSSSYNSQIVRFQNEHEETGNYQWGYENDDHQSQHAVGRFEKAYPGVNEDALEVKGSFSYVDTDNKKVLVEYTAGVNGYRETRTFQ